MARIAVFTDRMPDDVDWKGPVIWSWIAGLLESQHQVLVITTTNPTSLTLTHPRLHVANPAANWQIQNSVKFVKSLLPYQPEIIHTMGIKCREQLSVQTVWPVLSGMLQLFPRVRRFSTFFDGRELEKMKALSLWHKGSEHWTALSSPLKALAEQHHSRTVAVSPVDFEIQNADSVNEFSHLYNLIPAPVSSWREPDQTVRKILHTLLESPKEHIHVVGGWGDWPLHKRKEAWKTLFPVSHRVHMRNDMSFSEFLSELRAAESVWTEPLARDSWRALVSSTAAKKHDKSIVGPTGTWEIGSTVNFFSRLYTT